MLDIYYIRCTNFQSEDKQHSSCQQGESTWCKRQRDKLNGINYYKIKLNLPVATYNEIKGIFQDLSKDDLLNVYMRKLKM